MIYFDNAATSRYRPQCVQDAIIEQAKHPSNPGRSSHNDAVEAALIVHRARESIKTFVNNPDAEVILTKNCTEALNLAIIGTSRQGHIITSVMEHNSVLRPLFELQKGGLIRLTVLDQENGKINAANLEKKICPDTYMVAITHMSNVTGEVNDIAEIGKITSKQGILLLVDAAQSLGHIPFDMRSLGCDMVASAGHKGLHGAQGTGFLCYSRRIKVRPIIYGGTGTDSISTFQPHSPPESLESGTLNALGLAGLAAGVEWTRKNFDKINKHINGISEYIMQNMKTIKGIKIYSNNNNGVISFELNGYNSSQLADILNDRYLIAVRSGLHCAPLIHRAMNTTENGLTRVSVGYNNTMRDAKKLIIALKTITEEAIAD
ncbi:MAG: aminotransferase class V-fold PLP-dependent enzyme [Clostridia bacterium]|nr:aminotransferase class V-fold PLP-dependent enzyme [Clostridia bacterium]